MDGRHPTQCTQRKLKAEPALPSIHYYKLLSSEVGLIQERTVVVVADYTPEFMAFWGKYPGRYHEAGRPRADGCYEHYWKENKRKAFQWWRKLTVYQKKWAMYSVQFMKRGKYVPDAFRWLRDGKYEDIDMPEDRSTMPPEFVPKMKTVESSTVNVSNERNRQKDKLGVRH